MPKGATRGMEKHRFGQSGVHYSSDGRIMTGEREATFPRRKPFPHTRDDSSDYRSYDPYRERRRAERQTYRNTDKKRYEDPSPPRRPREPSPPSAYTRRYDRHDYDRSAYIDYRRPTNYDRRPAPVPEYNYDRAELISQRHPAPIPEYNYDKSGFIGQRQYRGDEGLLPRKHVYSREPPMNWTFIILGGLLLACAVINIMFCLDRHYFQGFWTGVLVLELGIWGLFHKGDYRSPWKTYMYTFLGVLSSIACFVGSAFVLKTLIPTVEGLALRKNVTIYVQDNGLDARKSYVAINADTRVWVCLGFDWATMVLLLASMYSMEAGIDAASSLFNTRNNFSRYFYRVDPFCKPVGFNPFVQIPLGQLAAFLGILSYFTAEQTDWVDYLSPVWAGALVVLAGSVSAFGMKRPDRSALNGVGVFLQVLAVGGLLTGIILLTLGMVDNIKLIREKTLPDGYFTNVVIVSCCLLAITIAVLLVNVFFTLAVIIKQVSILMGRDPESDDRSWVDSQESYSVHSRDPYDYDPYLYPQPQYRDWARY